jgi:exonuclease III
MRGGGSTTTSSKWNQINQLIRTENIGVLALQETHITREMATELKAWFGRLRIIVSPNPTHPTSREGVALVINKYTTQWKETTARVLIEGQASSLALSGTAKIQLIYSQYMHQRAAAVKTPTSGPS